MWSTLLPTIVVLCASQCLVVSGFAPQHAISNSKPNSLFSTTVSETASSLESINTQINVPKTLNEMIQQVSESIKLAAQQSEDDDDAESNATPNKPTCTRQIIRILLPRDSKSAQLGQYYENDLSFEEMSNQNILDLDSITLVPPDETWQGGIMQLYRAISVPTKLLLRNLGGTVGGVPPTILEDRSIDTSNVDGVGIFQSQVPNNPSKDICCFAQPLQESISVIESICEQAGKDRLVLILNPQWRSVDDALDAASKQGGIMGSFASFLGGKGNSLKRLEELGFDTVYSIEGYVCKGGNVRLMKRFDSDWIVFAENDSETE